MKTRMWKLLRNVFKTSKRPTSFGWNLPESGHGTHKPAALPLLGGRVRDPEPHGQRAEAQAKAKPTGLPAHTWSSRLGPGLPQGLCPDDRVRPLA